MNAYILFVLIGMRSPVVVGPFDSLLSCEKAAAQVSAVSENGFRSVRTTCLNLNAKPQTWNGKELKK